MPSHTPRKRISSTIRKERGKGTKQSKAIAIALSKERRRSMLKK